MFSNPPFSKMLKNVLLKKCLRNILLIFFLIIKCLSHCSGMEVMEKTKFQLSISKFISAKPKNTGRRFLKCKIFHLHSTHTIST